MEDIVLLRMQISGEKIVSTKNFEEATICDAGDNENTKTEVLDQSVKAYEASQAIHAVRLSFFFRAIVFCGTLKKIYCLIIF